jgi:hypothetical protein
MPLFDFVCFGFSKKQKQNVQISLFGAVFAFMHGISVLGPWSLPSVQE